MVQVISAGIVWYRQFIEYHFQYNTTIAMVSSQYGADGFVSIWHCPDTDSGNFLKTFLSNRCNRKEGLKNIPTLVYIFEILFNAKETYHYLKYPEFNQPFDNL